MKLKHPDTKAEVDARPEHVDMYLSQGWQKVTATKKAEPKPATKSD